MQIEKSIYISLIMNKQQIQVINNIIEQEFQKTKQFILIKYYYLFYNIVIALRILIYRF